MKVCPNHYYFLGMQFCKHPFSKCPYLGDSYNIELKIGKGKYNGNVTHCMINNVEVRNKMVEVQKRLQGTLDEVIKKFEQSKEDKDE